MGNRTSDRSMVLLIGVLLLAALASGLFREVVLDQPRLATAATVFSGVFVQALPFLAFGVVISGLVAAFVTPDLLTRRLPRRTTPAVLVAGVGGAALPGCECASVPVARRLFGDGGDDSGQVAGPNSRQGAAALTFMLSAPAINPVVLVSTAVAFPGHPEMVPARCGASLLTAVIMGLVWARWGKARWITRTPPKLDVDNASRSTVFIEAARHDFLQAGAYLVLGAAAAALLHVLVPSWVYTHLAGQLILGILTMAVLAVVLSLCSEADAFVAASLSMLPLVPRLVFLVVGPAVDVKLFAMQAGMFGRAFAIRFAPATFAVATVCASVVGLVTVG